MAAQGFSALGSRRLNEPGFAPHLIEHQHARGQQCHPLMRTWKRQPPDANHLGKRGARAIQCERGAER